jgi:hypothetical protein
VLYSFLPHKELRFIFPAVTAVNLAAAFAMARAFASVEVEVVQISSAKEDTSDAVVPSSSSSSSSSSSEAGFRRHRRLRQPLLAAATILLLVVSAAATVGVFTRAAAVNYAGGVAAAKVRAIVDVDVQHLLATFSPSSSSSSSSSSSLLSSSSVGDNDDDDADDDVDDAFIDETGTGVRVHFCDLACTTGLTRFLQHSSPLVEYSKKEHLTRRQLRALRFDYVVAETPTLHDGGGDDGGGGSSGDAESGGGGGGGVGNSDDGISSDVYDVVATVAALSGVHVYPPWLSADDERSCWYTGDDNDINNDGRRWLSLCVSVQMKPTLYVLKRRKMAHTDNDDILADDGDGGNSGGSGSSGSNTASAGLAGASSEHDEL